MENIMSYKQRTLDFLEIEWAAYIERFNRLPVEEGERRVKEQGYERFRDMLAHILSWWEEAMPLILAIAENREYERRKYNFDVFNAEAIAKYKDWDQTEFLVHFEKTRQKAVTDLRSVDEAAFENRRVRGWINGVFIHHAREHLVALGRFLASDTLEQEWGAFLAKFDTLENKDEYLKKQGFERLGDVLAHVIGWWDEGVKVVQGVAANPAFVYDEPDTDTFNVEIVAKYKGSSDADLRDLFEKKRMEMIALVRDLPQSMFDNPLVERWLAADVVEHFDEHDLNG
jgi:hypothetical protein